MAKSLQLTSISLSLLRSNRMCSRSTALRCLLQFPLKPKTFHKPLLSDSSTSIYFSTTSTPYPLQYDMIINRPTRSSLAPIRRRSARLGKSDSPEPEPEEPEALDSWVDKKLALERGTGRSGSVDPDMDKAKRKYYSKRRKRMYGTDSEDENRKNDDGYVELKPEVVEFDRLHQREEELYFYDTFAYPWEKDKHYKMVYQLEKKYFPDQCLDKAFLQPGESNVQKGKDKAKKKLGGLKKNDVVAVGEGDDDKKLVFFDEEKKEEVKKKDVTERKVEDFFKCLKKFPNEKAVSDDPEPFLVTRSGELPPSWDGPKGTVVLVNKPKGERVFCTYKLYGAMLLCVVLAVSRVDGFECK